MALFLNSSKKAFRPIAWIGVALLCFAGVSGCGSLWRYYFEDDFETIEANTEKAPVQLAREGVEAMRDEDYGDALERFQQLKERYPYSKYAILAELKVADAYFHKREYADAAVAYEEFVRLHPRNEVVPYVLYQMGMCHFLSFRSPDRDLEKTQLALETFERLARAYPDSKYARKAEKQILECQKRLTESEFRIARFYYHQEEYEAALKRFEHILDRYPQAVEELGYLEPIEGMYEKAAERAEEGDADKSIWTRLGF